MMSHSDYLDLLAKTTHEWPVCPKVITAGNFIFENGATFHNDHVIIYGRSPNTSWTFTKPDWLARRAELQNKPSWADAPEWARSLCQNNSGEWHWLDAANPTPRLSGWCADNVQFEFCAGRGEVLGDWRDTLETRPDMNKKHKTVTAASMLTVALGHMEDRAKTYDAPGGERSMGKTVSAFNIITGLELTEEQGWLFMEILKQVRSQQGNYRADNYEDMVAYAALRGECAARERGSKS